jgi:TolA-binding protein
MNKFIFITMVFTNIIAGRTLLAQPMNEPLQAIQMADVQHLKQQIKELQSSLLALKQVQVQTQEKVDSLANELAAVKTSAAKAQSKADEGVTAAGKAQSTADRAVQSAAAAQTAANNANARTSNSAIMVGAQTGRPWPSCPTGYHWIGGFNNNVTIAYPEMNRWHTNYSWLCVRD